MEGFAWKQGVKGLVKGWKRRWLVLKGGKVFYFKDKSDKFPKGAIALDQATNIASVANNFGKRNGYGFQINTHSRDWHLLVDTEEELDQWLEALNFARKNFTRNDLETQYDAYTKEELIALLIDKEQELLHCQKELQELKKQSKCK